MKIDEKKRGKHGCLTTLIILVLTVSVLAALIKSSAESLQVSEYGIGSEKLPDSFDGFRIVQLSDLHGSQFGKDGEGLVTAVRELEPDIIVLTGDFVTDEGDLSAVEKLAGRLAELCPVYFVSGNHEYGSGLSLEVMRIMRDAGVRWLGNEYVAIERGGEKIILGGVEDPLAYADMPTPDELVGEMSEAYPDAYKILLGHRNYWVTNYPELAVDLIFCGHAHGGIVRIPGVGGLIGTDRSLFPGFDAGLFRSGSYTLVVSRGLGNSVPVPRFLNRPEIVAVTLTAE